MDANILYDEQTTETTLSQINTAITVTLAVRQQEYSSIIAKFAKSECEQVTAMKTLLQQEQSVMSKITDMFKEMVSMLQEAAKETTQVEQDYTKTRVVS